MNAIPSSGDKVVFTTHYIRHAMFGVSVWRPVGGVPRTGIVVDTRTVSNARLDDRGRYIPTHHFEVLLVRRPGIEMVYVPLTNPMLSADAGGMIAVTDREGNRQ